MPERRNMIGNEGRRAFALKKMYANNFAPKDHYGESDRKRGCCCWREFEEKRDERGHNSQYSFRFMKVIEF